MYIYICFAIYLYYVNAICLYIDILYNLLTFRDLIQVTSIKMTKWLAL